MLDLKISLTLVTSLLQLPEEQIVALGLEMCLGGLLAGGGGGQNHRRYEIHDIAAIPEVSVENFPDLSQVHHFCDFALRRQSFSCSHFISRNIIRLYSLMNFSWVQLVAFINHISGFS
jgi:hypothetical protein